MVTTWPCKGGVSRCKCGDGGSRTYGSLVEQLDWDSDRTCHVCGSVWFGEKSLKLLRFRISSSRFLENSAKSCLRQKERSSVPVSTLHSPQSINIETHEYLGHVECLETPQRSISLFTAPYNINVQSSTHTAVQSLHWKSRYSRCDIGQGQLFRRTSSQ